MRREGRMHGSVVRLGKRPGQCLYREKLSSKPTNESKCTFIKRPIDGQSVPRIAFAEDQTEDQERSGQEALERSKRSLKVRDLDRNRLMQDWSMPDANCDCWDAYCEHSYIDDQTDVGAEEEEYWSRDRTRSEMVLPIESLLSTRRRKSVPKAHFPGHKEAPSTVGGGNGVENMLEDCSDQLESWWGVGFYDGEDVPDDWFLITDGEGVVT